MCSVEDCDRPKDGHGFCAMHRRRWRKHGTPTPDANCLYCGNEVRHGVKFCSPECYNISRACKSKNIPLSQYKEMYENQVGRCAACLTKDKLVLDHNHSTGRARALLCTKCNVIIGMCDEDPTVLEYIISFMRSNLFMEAV